MTKPYRCSNSLYDNSPFCEFHDTNFLSSPSSLGSLLSKLNQKIDECNKTSQPLECVGYILPAITLRQLKINMPLVFQNAVFHGPVDFSHCEFEASSFLGAQFRQDASFYETKFGKEATFQGSKFEKTAYFEKTHFKRGVDFSRTQFTEETIFDGTEFRGITDFSFCKILGEARFLGAFFKDAVRFTNVFLKNPENVIFRPDSGQMHFVSFANTDVSRIRFSEDVRFGLDKEFTIYDEVQLEHAIRLFGKEEKPAIPLGSVLGVYRNLRENYEYRMRYDEAGELFIREMEIKRKYKERWDKTKNMYRISLKNPVVRNLSLTGLYYHLSKYGQSILRPTLFGIGILLLSTFLWYTQSNAFGNFSISNMTNNFLTFNITGLSQTESFTHLRESFERSIINFIPLLPGREGIQLGLIDYMFKIIGGAVTFGLIIIALRRKFERKFRH
jgi:hypothetical protein